MSQACMPIRAAKLDLPPLLGVGALQGLGVVLEELVDVRRRLTPCVDRLPTPVQYCGLPSSQLVDAAQQP